MSPQSTFYQPLLLSLILLGPWYLVPLPQELSTGKTFISIQQVFLGDNTCAQHSARYCKVCKKTVSFPQGRDGWGEEETSVYPVFPFIQQILLAATICRASY